MARPSSQLQKKEVNSFGDVKLFFDNGQVIKSTKLSAGATANDKCDELTDHFSAAARVEDGSKMAMGLTFDIDLPFEDGSRERLLSGKNGSARVADVFLAYVDGSLQEAKWQINLRCPKPFIVSCGLEQNDETGQKKCVEYSVESENQTCAFGQRGLPYYFSDNKFSMVNIEGEVKFAGTSAELVMNKIAFGN